MIHIHRLVGPEFEHEPFEHGDEFLLGQLRIKALHTPGHRPEHTCFLLTDTRRGQEPWAVLTGDSLFVGDVARPDLAVERTEGARGIFRSLQDQLLTLPDYIEVWPGHLGGSMCGGPGMDLKVASTIGFERHHNAMLAIDDEQEFVDASVAKLGAQPPNFKAIVELNHGPLLTDGIEPARLFPVEVAQRQLEGALVVDVRTDVQFAEGHIPGSISIPLHRGGFGTKLAWVGARAPQIIFVGRDDEDGRRAGRSRRRRRARRRCAARRPARRRLDQLERRATSRWSRSSASRSRTSAATCDATPPAQVLDVREVAEFETGRDPRVGQRAVARHRRHPRRHRPEPARCW